MFRQEDAFFANNRIWSCGSVLGLIDDIPDCRTLVHRIANEAVAIIKDRLQSAVGA